MVTVSFALDLSIKPIFTGYAPGNPHAPTQTVLPANPKGKDHHHIQDLSQASTIQLLTFSTCADTDKTQIMLQAMSFEKRDSFFKINDWDKFKNKFINDFGNVTAFGREVQHQFSLSPRTDSMKDFIKVLAPKVQQLVTNLDCIAVFHPTDLLHNLTLTPAINEATCLSPFTNSSTPR